MQATVFRRKPARGYARAIGFILFLALGTCGLAHAETPEEIWSKLQQNPLPHKQARVLRTTLLSAKEVDRFIDAIGAERLSTLSDPSLVYLLSRSNKSFDALVPLTAENLELRDRFDDVWTRARLLTLSDTQVGVGAKKIVAFGGMNLAAFLGSAIYSWASGETWPASLGLAVPTWVANLGASVGTIPIINRAGNRLGSPSRAKALSDATEVLRKFNGSGRPLTPEILESMKVALADTYGFPWRDLVGRRKGRLYGTLRHSSELVPPTLEFLDSMLDALSGNQVASVRFQGEEGNPKVESALSDIEDQGRSLLREISSWAEHHGRPELAERARDVLAKHAVLFGSDSAVPGPIDAHERGIGAAAIMNLMSDRTRFEGSEKNTHPETEKAVAARDVSFRRREGAPSVTVSSDGKQVRFNLPWPLFREVAGFSPADLDSGRVQQKIGNGVWLTTDVTQGKFFFVPFDDLNALNAPKDVTIEVWKSPWKSRERPLLRLSPGEGPVPAERVLKLARSGDGGGLLAFATACTRRLAPQRMRGSAH